MAQLFFFLALLTFVNYTIITFTDLIKGLKDISLGDTLDKVWHIGDSQYRYIHIKHINIKNFDRSFKLLYNFATQNFYLFINPLKNSCLDSLRDWRQRLFTGKVACPLTRVLSQNVFIFK